MKLRIQACSDKGRRRDNNEDMLSVGGRPLRDGWLDLSAEVPEEGAYEILVSDGMGGHEKGEVASEELLERITSFLSDLKTDDFVSSFCGFVADVSGDFNRRAREEGQRRYMGCTLSGVVWYNGRAYLVNCGDSRTYRFRNGRLAPLTIDDTERGITGNPFASGCLFMCVGGGSTGYVKVTDLTDRLTEGDMLIVSSDGLTNEVEHSEMEEILSKDPEPAMGLTERANDNGGSDNISVITALVGGGDFAPDEEEIPDDDGRYDAWA